MDQPQPQPQLPTPPFVIEAPAAKSMAESSGLPLSRFLHSLVHSALPLARPPISRFPVAAVGVGPTGRIFVGVNLEFPGLPLHHTVHAEQFLVTNLLLHAEPHLRHAAVSAAPCGHCRQFLQEIRGAPDVELLVTSHQNPQFTPLSHFLSHRFGPRDLLPHDAPLLLEPRHNGLSFLGPGPGPQNRNRNRQENGICNGNVYLVADEKLKVAALEAANKSHAPYSASPSGVALMDCDGHVYAGSYMESAAFNPGLGPVQAALVAFVAGGGGGYESIAAAVLVEKEGAVVKQEATGKLLIGTISPDCHFSVFFCS